MPSCIASSFSHGDAFISSKPERTMTLTSAPPRRRAVRQQSIAVLPPPSTITRLPIRVDVAERNRSTASRCRCGCWRAASLRPGIVEIAPARRAAADEDRVVAFGRAAPCIDSMRCAGAEFDAESRM